MRDLQRLENRIEKGRSTLLFESPGEAVFGHMDTIYRMERSMPCGMEHKQCQQVLARANTR